jgi:hypothetical protein
MELYDVEVEITGCDDENYFNLIDLTEDELFFLLKISNISKKSSKSMCQPTLSINNYNANNGGF